MESQVNEMNATVETHGVPTISRDETINLSDLLKESKEPVIKEKSELQKMAERKEADSKGLVVDNVTLEASNKSGPPKLVSQMSGSDEDMQAYLDDMDQKIEAAKHVKISMPVTDDRDMASLMDELDTVAKTGEAAKDTIVANKSFISIADPSETTESESSEDNNEVVAEVTAEAKEKQDRRNELVQVIIDKTGLGGVYNFTEEEKEKISTSRQIKLTEVESLDIESVNFITPEKSFLDTINEYQISSAQSPITFPASRFKANMGGLSFGELGDMMFDTENVTFDQMHKRLTVIYNKMYSPTCGKFESFEDFLHKFAYVDIDLAVYGLIIATFPEIDQIQLKCNNDKCNNVFNYSYSPRTLLQLDQSSDKFLTSIKDVAVSRLEDAEELIKESPVRKHKLMKLPLSGFIIELGMASAYDYLYTIIDNMNSETFREKFPDDINGIMQINTAMLAMIRSVSIPHNGAYIKYDKFEDIVQALYNIKPEEIMLLGSLLADYTTTYATSFAFKDITCPHCGALTPQIDVDINSLVFQKFQLLMSTEVNIDNMQSI